MAYTFDDRTVSDLHKDARGFRPGAEWWSRWNAMGDDRKQEEWDHLIDEMTREMEYERQREARAHARWTAHIDHLMADNGVDRATAIRWDMDAMEVHGDVGYYCYQWGIAYRNEEGINRVLAGERLPQAA